MPPLTILIVSIIIIFYVYSTFYVEKETYKIIKDNLCQSIRIVQISDLHGRVTFINGRISELINDFEPDYLVVTGDLSNKSSQLENVLNELSKVKVKKRRLIVLGNYERETVKRFKKVPFIIDPLLKHFEERYNVLFLVNNYLIDDYNGQKVLFYGFDNSKYGNEKFCIGYEHEDVLFSVFIAHSPNIINLIEELEIKYDVLLTGHTHGNQINVPIIKSIKNQYSKFHVGMRRKHERYFYISRGLGTAKLPIRVNCKPVITVFDVNRS